MQPQMKMVCPNSYIEYQQVVKCLYVRERAGIIWLICAGRRLDRNKESFLIVVFGMLMLLFITLTLA